LYQFPATALVGVLGLGDLWHKERAIAVLLLLIALGDVLFLLAATDPSTGGHYVWNLHYYLQLYVVFAIWVAAGFRWAEVRWRRVGRTVLVATVLMTLVLPVIVYAIAPAAAQPFTDNLPGFRPLPGRDNLPYVLSPWKHGETGARAYGESILSWLPPNSVIFADYSIWALVRYLHVVEDMRPDIQLIRLPFGGKGKQLPLILEYQDQAQLFLADTYAPYYDVEDIRQSFNLVPSGPIYRLVPTR
jgi:hypothetical protein